MLDDMCLDTSPRMRTYALLKLTTYQVQNILLYSCKQVIVGDLQAGAPYSLSHAAYQGMIPKGKLGWLRWPHRSQQGASLMHLDGLRACIGVIAGCTTSVIFPRVGGVKLVHFQWKLPSSNRS